MLLRTTFSSTKKFFQRTVDNVKSFLSGGYQRLPKNSPCNSFPCAGGGCGGGGGGSIHDHAAKCSQSYKELGKCSTEFVNDHRQASQGGIIKRKETARTEICRKDGEGDRKDQNQKKKKIVYDGKRFYQEYSRSGKVLERQKNRFLVAKKLKELEMLDNGNMEHVLDIEEVLHYYSLLTCPAYVDIVDQFFTEVYSELLNGQASVTSRFHRSRPMLQRVGFYH